MTWKILTIITGTLLIGSAVFSYQNRLDLEKQRNKLTTSTATLDTRQTDLSKTKSQNQTTTAQINSRQSEIENLTVEIVSTEHKLVATQAESETVQSQVELAKTQLKNAQQIDLESLQKQKSQIAHARTTIEEAEIELTKTQRQVVAVSHHTDLLSERLSQLETLRHDQENLKLPYQFRATVTAAYSKWGFLVLDQGNDGGSIAMSTVAISREGKPIASAIITHVTPDHSVADIIPGTLAHGQSIQIGDLISPLR